MRSIKFSGNGGNALRAEGRSFRGWNNCDWKSQPLCEHALDGSVRLDVQALEDLNQDERAALRNRLVGFVFQGFQFLPTLIAIENVLVPLELRGETGREKDAAELLKLGER